MGDKRYKTVAVVDVLSLMGDTSDNVPGVEKIGLKTAAQLIQQYGSIDGILKTLMRLKGNVARI